MEMLTPTRYKTAKIGTIEHTHEKLNRGGRELTQKSRNRAHPMDVSDGNEAKENVVARYKKDKSTNKRPNTVHFFYSLFFVNIYQLRTV